MQRRKVKAMHFQSVAYKSIQLSGVRPSPSKRRANVFTSTISATYTKDKRPKRTDTVATVTVNESPDKQPEGPGDPGAKRSLSYGHC